MAAAKQRYSFFLPFPFVFGSGAAGAAGLESAELVDDDSDLLLSEEELLLELESDLESDFDSEVGVLLSAAADFL
jgi:hypothetical protein